MAKDPEKSYISRFNRVCDYIASHLEEELLLEKLSQVAGFSKFHFQRQFSEFMGVTVGRYIQLLRLKRASYRLVYDEKVRIIEIAMEAGFENPESFSRAFKKAIGCSPSEFRRNPVWEEWNKAIKIPVVERNEKMNVEIVDFNETKIAVLEHCASPALLNHSVSKFIEWRKSSKLSPVSTSRTFGLAYDDPETTEAEKFRFDICGEVKKNVPENSQGVINKIIPGGRCASIRHIGPMELMNEKVHYLYRDWLPASGESLRDFPCFFEYVNFFPQVAESELISNIYLPLE